MANASQQSRTPLRRAAPPRATARVARTPARSADEPIVATRGGGLLVVGGPPLGGKSLLATTLAQLVPGALPLIAMDNVAQATEAWFPHGSIEQPVERPAAKMLSAAQSIWWSHLETRSPTIVLCARFETPFMRRRAQLLAERVLRTDRFLFVEARSDGVGVVRRLAGRVLPVAKLAQRVNSYRKACARYQPIDRVEARRLRCLRLSRVRGDLVSALDRVLVAWAELG